MRGTRHPPRARERLAEVMTDHYTVLDRNEVARDPVETAKHLDEMGERESVLWRGESLHDAADVVRGLLADLTATREALATEKARHGNEELLRAVQVASEARDAMARDLRMLELQVRAEHAALDAYASKTVELDLVVAATRAVLQSISTPKAGR